jgi:iron complex outermembrane receptor protein
LIPSVQKLDAKAVVKVEISSGVICYAAGLALVTGSAGVSAQEPEGVLGLEEIVVTARKREESIQDAPLTIQAFNDRQIEERGTQNLNDLAKFVPGLTLNGGSSAHAGTATAFALGSSSTSRLLQPIWSIELN